MYVYYKNERFYYLAFKLLFIDRLFQNLKTF